jgi:hypothetical protein
VSYAIDTPLEGIDLLCAKCHAENIEEILKREWLHYHDMAGGLETMLPVLYHYNHCKNCGNSELDQRTAKENAAVIEMFHKSNAHFWTPGEGSFCVNCGVLNPMEAAENQGLFDVDSLNFASSPEGELAQWHVSRINVFGCHIYHSEKYH